MFRLDRAGIIERLRGAAERLLAEREEVLDIRLFGSLARGEAVPGSDADILIIVSGDAGPFLDRSTKMSPYFDRVGIGCDVFVYSEAEVEGQALPPVAATALNDGIVLNRRVVGKKSG